MSEEGCEYEVRRAAALGVGLHSRAGLRRTRGAASAPTQSGPCHAPQVHVVCDGTFPVAPPGCCYGAELRIDDKEVGGSHSGGGAWRTLGMVACLSRKRWGPPLSAASADCWLTDSPNLH
jgi:hypothetical protein